MVKTEAVSPIAVIIPTWNNLPYLQLCIQSLRKNSFYSIHIILHINDGSDGTLKWADQQQIPYTYSESNVGICTGVNQAFNFVDTPYVIYLNDDMYVCPDWDKHLVEEAQKYTKEPFMLSATMIEPKNTKNPAVIHADYGDSIENFREKDLLMDQPVKDDWQGASWPPIFLTSDMWRLVGGFSEEFSPGFYSDPDLSMKLWKSGCRVFQGVGRSTVYHFQQKSTKRVEKNPGKKQFLVKWGIVPSAFYTHYLRMGAPFMGETPEPDQNVKLFLQQMKSSLLKKL